MKIRRMMAIVAALALLIWLAIPAVRIWLDPMLLAHSHAFDRGVGEGPVSISPNQALAQIEADHIVFSHDVSFWKVYRQILVNPGASDPEVCPYLTRLIRSSRPESKNLGPGSMATSSGLEPPPTNGPGRPSPQP